MTQSLYLSISLAFSFQIPSQKPSAELSDVLDLSFSSNGHASSQKFFSLVQNSELNLSHELTLNVVGKCPPPQLCKKA